ncbi:MAG TPA: MFS transporter [Methylotenera sp.]|nr:MFS transporter [Methylotenera sp.]HPH04597.1 MFS transporter [Methylotenera sp.]HPN00728.1 MFS transporter [Methylotenera sp.]
MRILSHPIFTNHQHAFLKLLAFRVLIVLAYQIMAVAVGWHVYEITRDTLSLGLIGLVEVVPYFASALFAGYAVDHHCSRRFFGALAACLLGLSAISLAIISSGWLASGSTLWIYAAFALTGIGRAFISPSHSSLFALIIAREEYARAASIGSSVFQAGLVIGPAIGGLLVGFASKDAAYLMAIILCIGAALAITSIRIKEPPPLPSAPVMTSIGEGLRFVFSHQILLGALSLDMFAVLFGGAVAMLPAFVKDVYQIGPEVLGFLRSTPAVGAILTGIWLTRHPINKHAGRWLLSAVAGFGLCIIGFGLVSNFWLAGVILALSGVCDGVSVVMRQTIMQLATPDHMRGRVSAINGIFIGSSNELGAFESGVAAKLMGLVPSVIFGGLMTLGVVAVTAKIAPKLRALELNQLH